MSKYNIPMDSKTEAFLKSKGLNTHFDTPQNRKYAQISSYLGLILIAIALFSTLSYVG